MCRGEPSPDHHTLTIAQGESSEKGDGPVLEGQCKSSVVERTLGIGLLLFGQAPKKSLSLHGWAPPPLRARPEGYTDVFVFPLIMNNAGEEFIKVK